MTLFGLIRRAKADDDDDDEDEEEEYRAELEEDGANLGNLMDMYGDEEDDDDEEEAYDVMDLKKVVLKIGVLDGTSDRNVAQWTGFKIKPSFQLSDALLKCFKTSLSWMGKLKAKVRQKANRNSYATNQRCQCLACVFCFAVLCFDILSNNAATVLTWETRVSRPS